MQVCLKYTKIIEVVLLYSVFQ